MALVGMRDSAGAVPSDADEKHAAACKNREGFFQCLLHKIIK